MNRNESIATLIDEASAFVRHFDRVRFVLSEKQQRQTEAKLVNGLSVMLQLKGKTLTDLQAVRLDTALAMITSACNDILRAAGLRIRRERLEAASQLANSLRFGLLFKIQRQSARDNDELEAFERRHAAAF